MKAAIIGGGSLRLIPLLRGALQHKQIFEGGEIRLVDTQPERAEWVARALLQTPECAGLGCKITWGQEMDAALDGADVVYATMGIISRMQYLLAHRACLRSGFAASEQLSPIAAFMALSGGRFMLDLARRMEKYCQKAPLLVHSNPISIYSGVVSNHSRIKSYGVCTGYRSHGYDITRLLGRNEYCADYDVDVAGVNHLSFILKGAYKGEDVYKLLERQLTEDWVPPKISDPMGARRVQNALRKLHYMYGRFGRIVFASESDGMAHLFHEEMIEEARKDPWNLQSVAEMRAMVKEEDRQYEKKYERVRKAAAEGPDSELWSRGYDDGNYLFGVDDKDVMVPILKGLAGMGTQKVVVSAPNKGTVGGFKDWTLLEYSMLIEDRKFKAAQEYDIPNVFHGLISGLATHQTMVADAVFAQDPKLFADALFAYPVKQNWRETRELFKELLEIFAADSPLVFQKTKQYLQI